MFTRVGPTPTPRSSCFSTILLVGLGQAFPLVTDFHSFYLPRIRDALSDSR